MNNSVNVLASSKPGQAFRILKRLGAHPEDCVDNTSTFTLPLHEKENYSPETSAEVIAQHFSSISQEFPPLICSALPRSVRDKLNTPGNPPQFTEYDVFCKIKQAKKPNGGTPSDIPKKLISEFTPELTAPMTHIINNIFKTGEWPAHWKREYVIPITKKEPPQSEDDLRPISLTPFFSKVSEHFVVDWLMKYISHSIDFRQYGGMKGNSITHYLIEFINFILTAQDGPNQTAVLACYVDFQKAFNRQNYLILIKKLSDLDVPGWLLSIIISFLQNRSMSVKYNGCMSSVKSLPGGSPQGTLLALLLFIVFINDIGFDRQTNNVGEVLTSRKHIKAANEIHLKFVDDLTLAETVNLQHDLVEVPELDRIHPTKFHDRTGHTFPTENSKVYNQLLKTEQHARENEMRVNYEKTKLMLFNPCKSIDFNPEVTISDKSIELVSQTKLLGLVITNDLKWAPNTTYLVKKAYKRLWMLRRLKNLGANQKSLCAVYIKQIRCVLEMAVPAWNGSITLREKVQIERVQKCAFHIILGDSYNSYENALDHLNLETLEERRFNLSLKFALKVEKSPKFNSWFKPNPRFQNSRTIQPKYCPVAFKHDRLKKSPIGYLTNILNTHYSSHKSKKT